MANFIVTVVVTCILYTLVQMFKEMKHIRGDTSRLVTKDVKDDKNANA